MNEIGSLKSTKEEAILKLKQLELSVNHKTSEIADIKENIKFLLATILERKWIQCVT